MGWAEDAAVDYATFRRFRRERYALMLRRGCFLRAECAAQRKCQHITRFVYGAAPRSAHAARACRALFCLADYVMLRLITF